MELSEIISPSISSVHFLSKWLKYHCKDIQSINNNMMQFDEKTTNIRISYLLFSQNWMRMNAIL